MEIVVETFRCIAINHSDLRPLSLNFPASELQTVLNSTAKHAKLKYICLTKLTTS